MNKYKIRYKILSVCLFEIISLNMWGQYSDVSMELANSLSSMADFYSSADNYTKAIELEKQSLEIRRELFGDHSSEYILSASTLAGYFFNVGDFKNAVKYGEEIIRLYAELAGKENDEYTVLLSILVEYHHKNGTYQKMIEYQIEMIDLYEKMYGEDIQHYAFNQAVLSQFYSDIGDYPNAIEAAEKSVAVYRKNNETKDLNYMLALNNLADLYYTRGFLNGEDKSRSIKMKEEVVGIAAENYGRDNIEYAKWLSNYALYYLNANGNDNKVQKFVHEVKEIYENEKNLSVTDCSGLLGNLSNCLSILGDNESAIKYGLELINYIDKDDISYSSCLKDLAKYYANMKNYSQATEYISFSLKSIRKLISRSSDDQDLYRHYLYWNATNLFDMLVNYVSKNPTDSVVSMLFDEAINTRALRLRNGIGKWYTWKDVRSHINENEIVIELVNYGSVEEKNGFIYALILKKEMTHPQMIIVSDYNEFQDSLLHATSKYDQDHKLGQIVWGRLANELDGVKNVYFTPTWILTAMPTEYFPINENLYYNEKYNMYRLTSTRELIERNQDDDHYSNAYLYGDLSYEKTTGGQIADTRSGLEPLPNTKIEIDEISAILNKNRVKTIELTGSNGTEQSIKNLSGTDIEILHIATHGGYLKNNEEIDKVYRYSLIPQYSPRDDVHANSFLAMSGANSHLNPGESLNNEEDGLLTASEVSCLDLHNIKIVVLSACETGMGNFGTDDMIWGVQRGFKEAGVKSILMSLKKVDDEATRILMVEFYKNLMSGKSKLQSLKDAQKHLRQVDNGKFNKPEYWASFIMLDGLN